MVFLTAATALRSSRETTWGEYTEPKQVRGAGGVSSTMFRIILMDRDRFNPPAPAKPRAIPRQPGLARARKRTPPQAFRDTPPW